VDPGVAARAGVLRAHVAEHADRRGDDLELLAFFFADAHEGRAVGRAHLRGLGEVVDDLDAREIARQRPASVRAARVGRDLDAALRVFLLRGVGRNLGLVEEPELEPARLLAGAPEALVAEQPHVLFQVADLRGLFVDAPRSLDERIALRIELRLLLERQRAQRIDIFG